MARVPDVVSRRNRGLRHFGGAVPGVLSLGDVHRVPGMLEVGGGRPAGAGSAIGSQTWSGTERPEQW